ncbi:phospholipase D-like domain-containing protein [Sphingobium sp. BS19]|uniref:phospholipase D-like domain-containing protein n=1 Tax=Sphingobium sp. BS19 TaxID=3018973 RepID=UPI0022EF7E06|nr:phospholipase D-like domain-containing protein [Sphingobium sp. BS19]GLI99011.1 hypothetical protein Sbs19_28290 [Sphingobium sp. BS19]
MSRDFIRLLREHELAPAFRKALKRAKSAVIAVPFWGKGAVKLLGLDAGHSVRVICNLDHPGCNPFVIEELRKHKVKVRTHRRLHAKLYATDAVAIVGSSNASTNGLTVEGKEAQGWVELNVTSGEADFVDGVLAEFETLWCSDETVPVRSVDIKRAKAQHAKLPPFAALFADDLGLFEVVRKMPTAFADVYLAVYDDDLSKNARGALGVFQKNANRLPDSGFDAASIKNAWGYQFRSMPEPAWLIDVSCKGEAHKYVGTARSLGIRIAVVDEDGFPENDLVPALRGPIVIAGKSFRPDKEERALLERHGKALLKISGGAPLPIAKAVAFIDKRS